MNEGWKEITFNVSKSEFQGDLLRATEGPLLKASFSIWLFSDLSFHPAMCRTGLFEVSIRLLFLPRI